MSKSEYWKKLYERNVQIAAYLDQGCTIEFLIKKFELSRSEAYRLASLYASGGLAALVPGSRARKQPQGTDERIVDLICALRTRLGLSADRIEEHLRERAEKLQIQPEQIPTARTVHRLLVQHQKIQPKVKPRRRAIVDYYRTRHGGYPNHIVESDLKCDRYVQRQRVNLFGHLEQFSRSVVASIHKEQTTRHCCENFLDYLYRYGIPEVAKSDNGAVYIGNERHPAFGIYTKLCLYLGIEQIFIPFAEPKWNVFIERFFRTWDEECFDKERHPSWSALLRHHGRYLQKYNHQRTHQAIAKATPDAYFQQHRSQIKQRFPNIDRDRLQRYLEEQNLPLKSGSVSFIRRVEAGGTIRLKTHTYTIGKALVNKHVKATVFVQAGQRKFDVLFWYKDMQLSKNTYAF